MRKERGDADARRVHADAAATQADGIEADQAGVTGQAEYHGERDLRAAELPERLADRTIAVLVELIGQAVQGQGEDQQRDDDGGNPLPGWRGRDSGGIDGGGHRRKGAAGGARAVSTRAWRIVRLSSSFDQWDRRSPVLTCRGGYPCTHRRPVWRTMQA